jgi:hypothetical protein
MKLKIALAKTLDFYIFLLKITSSLYLAWQTKHVKDNAIEVFLALCQTMLK